MTAVTVHPGRTSRSASEPPADAAIIALARRVASRAKFLRESLTLVATELAAEYAVIYARLRSQVVDDYWHCGPADPSFWKDRLRAHLTDVLNEETPGFRLIACVGRGEHIATLAGILRNPDGSKLGAIGLVLKCPDDAGAEALHQRLEARLNLIACLAAGLESDSCQHPAVGSTRDLEQLSRLAGYQTVRQLAFAITNNLRNKTGCEQAALAIARRSRVRILCVSGFELVNERSPAVNALREAMEECLDAARPVGDQSAGDWTEAAAGDHRLHRQWREQLGGGCVASIPVTTEDGTTAIISLARAQASPFDEKELEHIRALIAPHVAAFGLVDRAGRSLPAHALDSTRNALATVVQPTAWARKAAAVALILASLWFCFGVWSFRLPVAATVAPSQVRHLSAAMEAPLVRVHFTAGDAVRAGDILCEFDHAELILDRQRLLAELAMRRLEEGKAMADGSRVDAQLAQARQQVLAARLGILDERIARAVVRAPFDGVIVSGDLRASVGEVLPMGHPLFKLATSSAWKLELEIPQSMSDQVRAGLGGSFVTHARPDEAQRFEITRVTPAAVPRRGANVYLAEAHATMDQPWMRSGVEGQARIEIGDRPVWWVALHRVIDYLRLNFWL